MWFVHSLLWRLLAATQYDHLARLTCVGACDKGALACRGHDGMRGTAPNSSASFDKAFEQATVHGYIHLQSKPN